MSSLIFCGTSSLRILTSPNDKLSGGKKALAFLPSDGATCYVAVSSASTEHCAQSAFEQIGPGKPPHAACHKFDGRMSDPFERFF